MNRRLLPEGWDSLSPQVDRLLDAPAGQRDALLDEFSGGDAGRRAMLLQLVTECERELPIMEQPVVDRFQELLRDEDEPVLPDVLGGRYRIERELGRGGMARVYLALDLKHARHVAIKVIRPELAASLGRDRFLREIGIAARLRHPNIMPLYDSGDVDGLLYFVMPFESGKSLHARLKSGPHPSVSEAVSILRDVARALSYAHEQGVVHRDVKPDNVLLSGTAAVVTDFGIAKAVTAALTQADGGLTVTGSVIGTPAYMAPEQAMADPAADHRADIYAFGCLAYELFAGQPPFTGSTTYQVLAAQMSEQPVPINQRCTDVPPAVASLIMRCLEKDPAARPASAAALLQALDGTTSMQALPSRRSRSRRLIPALVMLVVLVAAGSIAAAYFTRGAPVTVAVLPLGVGGDSVQSLAEGFSDDIATSLVRVPWIHMKSRGGAGNYRGQTVIDSRAVGQALGAQYIVVGSLRKNDGLSLLVQLLKTDDGSFVWGKKFDHFGELETIRDSVVAAISDTLRTLAGRSAKDVVASPPRPRHKNNDAYLAYLVGKKLLNERGRSIGESIDRFRQAIALDSLSAEAWSGLSLALAIRPIFEGVPVESVMEEAAQSATFALKLDPTLGEPHVARGMLRFFTWQWDEAGAEFQIALARNKHDTEARHQYGRLLQFRNRKDEAMQQFLLGLEDDPASAVLRAQVALAWFNKGNIDSALVWSEGALRVNPKNFVAALFRSMILVRANRGAEARALVKDALKYDAVTLYVLAASGDTATVRERLATLATSGYKPGQQESARAYAYLGLKDTANALAALERATDKREVWPVLGATSMPMFDDVRESPRFRALLKRVKLAEH